MAVTVNIPYHLEHRAKWAGKTFSSYIANRLADAFRPLERKAGRQVRRWFVFEHADDGGYWHLHGAVELLPGTDEAALKELLSKAVEGCKTTFGPKGERCVHIQAFDPLRSYGGASGAAGWCCYCWKDAPRTRRLGGAWLGSIVISTHPTTRLAKAHHATIATRSKGTSATVGTAPTTTSASAAPGSARKPRQAAGTRKAPQCPQVLHSSPENGLRHVAGPAGPM